MLILSRRVGESIVINDEITITITGMNHYEARIGVTAPKDIPIHRQEIYSQILEENGGKRLTPLGRDID